MRMVQSSLGRLPPKQWGCGVVLGVVSVLTAIHAAEPVRHPVVPGYERLYADPSAKIVDAGWLLLGELNCLSCHEAGHAVVSVQTKLAPHLDELGARVRPEFVRDLLTDPQRAKPGTTMPHVLHHGTEAERGQQIEALVHFLASTGNLAESAAVTAAARRGERLYHAVGCVACHEPRGDVASHTATSVPLPTLSAKYSVPSLTRFLENPLAVRPSGRMPQMHLTADEARDLACFLLSDLELPSSMAFQYYEGSWDKLPDFDSLPVKDAGGASSFDVNVGNPDHFGVRFEGRFRVEQEGSYTFHLASDDGSRLFIDGQLVVDNDGIHGVVLKSGSRQLSAGEHAFRAEYFEQAGGQEMSIEFEGPGTKRQSLEFALVAREAPATKPRFRLDAGLATRGREVFQQAGCASCHALKVDGQRLQPGRSSKKLTDCNPVAGCLSGAAQPGLPFYPLSAAQRHSLQQALVALRRQADAPPPAEPVMLALARFNCVACHERNGTGGVESSRNRHFQTNQPEMGDEGRLPPPLTGIGAKLNDHWLRQVLVQGAKDRPYMLTRMPRFGDDSLGNLAAQLVAIDHPGPVVAPSSISTDRKLKSAGRQLVGEKGLSCVKCHTWGDTRATGIQAISLTTMTQRLRPTWFHRYLLNPQEYRPGTRMPAAWPGGQSALPSVLDGDADRQIRAVWSFLEDGANANMPIGLVANPIELVPETEPIVYRNFLDGAGTRAIGVGYPEKVNLAFDAEQCRLALAWQGAFLDASLHWVGRGPGFQKPLGDNVLRFPDGPPLAVLSKPDDAWPSQSARALGYQFGGYRLDAKRRPTFLFRWNALRVEELLEPVAAGGTVHLRRSLRVMPPIPAQTYFRAAVASEIRDVGGGWFDIQGDWRLRLPATSTPPLVRGAPGRRELLVPLPSAENGHPPVVIVQEMVW